jgi:aldose 1-epimerase
MTSLIALSAGALELDLAPAVGGSVARFDIARGGAREALLRAAPPGNQKVLEAGLFPLVPFANRLRGGAFECDGRTIRLSPNMAGDKSPIHGQGWLGTWATLASDERSARLVFSHEPGEWPWAYRAELAYELDEAGLSVTLACRNLSAEPMPCGLGLHPYHPCNGRTRLDARVDWVWTIDADVLPVERIPAAGRYGLSNRAICGQDLDNGFEGWTGASRLSWPDRGLAIELTSPDADRFQVFSPKAGGLVVVEPVQNANAALNEPQAQWPGLGLATLRRGEESRLRARFEVLSHA